MSPGSLLGAGGLSTPDPPNPDLTVGHSRAHHSLGVAVFLGALTEFVLNGLINGWWQLVYSCPR